MVLRILFTFVGGRGHLDPLVPIAAAARAAGHSIAFACSRSMAGAVVSAGFDVVDDPEAAPSETTGRAAGPEPSPPASEPGPLLEVDRAREERDLREKFVADGGRREAARVLRTAPAWRPDVFVCDETDVGAVVAAERLGIPCATVVVLAAGGMLRPDVVAATLDEVRAEHGLASDPGLARARGGLVVDPTPPGYRDPGDPLPASATRVALVRPGAPETMPRPWQPVRPAGPAVYVTLGTVFPLESGDLLARVIAAFDDHPGDVLITVGQEVDPASLGPVPAHIHLAGFVAQVAVLPHVALVVSHAGSGTVLGALAHGRPMVLLPMGADQPWNGDRCAAIGVARVLDPVTATVADIREAVRAVLADPAMRAAAETASEWMLAMPPTSAALEANERHATARRLVDL
jgi:UDP:flavonoid glycosyltransferase YjiC (YdhE family)